jgi:hypothetical protein
MSQDASRTPTKAHVFLPRLTQISFQVPKEVGIWDGTNDKSTLNTIAKDIPVASAGPINSIPDIWARPVMFNLFLSIRGDADPLPKRIRQEWRGLLSILALQELAGFTVELVPLNVNEIRVETLASPLLKLKPRAVQWGGVEHDWSRLVLIRVRKDDDVVCLGAFSPTTLVFSGSDYSSRMKPKLVKALEGFLGSDEGGRLLLRAPEAGDKRARPLRLWLSRMKSALGALDTKKNVHSTILLKELNDWILELGEEASDATGYEYLSPRPAADKITDGLPLYSLLCHRIQPVRSEGKGHFSLRAEREFKEGLRDVLVVAPSLFRSGRGVPDAEWGLFSPLAVRGGDPEAELDRWFRGDSGTEFAGARLDGALWIRPEQYFFCEKLLRAKGGASWLTSECLNGDPSTVLPLNTRILEFFSADRVWSELRPRIEEREDKTRVTIDLPVGTGAETIRISRDYGPAEIVETDPIAVEVFPRYLGPDWLRYYVVSGESGSLTCRACTLPSSKTVSGRTFQRPGRNGRPGARIEVVASSPGTDDTGAFPEAVSLRLGGAEAGLLLLKRDERDVEERPERWTVGIDFGTSNTNVWTAKWDNATSSRVGKQEPLTVDLASFFRRLSNGPETIDRKDWLKDCFVPPVTVSMPIASAVRVTRAQESEVLATSFAHFMTDLDVPADVTAPIKFGNRELQAAYFDSLLVLVLLAGRPVKGGHTLRQLELRFTYPKVFSRDEKQQFISTWKERIELIHSAFLRSWDDLVLGNQDEESDSSKDFVSKGKDGYVPEFLITEGAAAARFFTSNIVSEEHRAAQSQGLACVDVGGGTTDLTLYTLRGIAYDTSVMLAGQTISKYLRKRPNLWGKLFDSKIAEKLREAHAQGQEGQFGLYLNYGLTSDATGILGRLGSHATDGDLSWVKRMILFQFASVAHFAGIVAGRDEMVVALSKKKRNPQFCWGGRAAQFLSWLDGGSFDPRGISAQVLEGFYFNSFSRTSGFEYDNAEASKPRFTLSPMPKSEAAGGVIESDQAHRNNSEGTGRVATAGAGDGQSAGGFGRKSRPAGDGSASGEDLRAERTKVLAGDEIELIDREDVVRPTEEVSEGQLFSGSGTSGRLNVIGLPLRELGTFVSLCNDIFYEAEFCKSETDEFLSVQDRAGGGRSQFAAQVEKNVMSALEKEAIKPAGKRVLEPLFFSEVRAFIDLTLAKL